MKKGEKKTPHIYYDRLASLSPQEKEELRQILTSKVYLKLMRITEAMKPSANCASAGSLTRDAFSNERANARLGEIRGWELHIAALFMALAEAAPKRTEAEPTYPDEGMLPLAGKPQQK